jgi:hypothetical protein
MSGGDRCRSVWEQGGDPLAVCVAVIASDLPDWLKNAVLVLVTMPDLSERWWRGRTRDAIDAIRAAEIAGIRAHPEAKARNGGYTWEEALDLGEHFARRREGTGALTAAGAKRVYERVVKGLEEHTRYHRAPEGTVERIKQAWRNQEAIMTAALRRRE